MLAMAALAVKRREENLKELLLLRRLRLLLLLSLPRFRNEVSSALNEVYICHSLPSYGCCCCTCRRNFWVSAEPSASKTEAKEDFDGECSVQVYCMQACLPKDPAVLWNAEYIQAEELFKQPVGVDNCLRDNSFVKWRDYDPVREQAELKICSSKIDAVTFHYLVGTLFCVLLCVIWFLAGLFLLRFFGYAIWAFGLPWFAERAG